MKTIASALLIAATQAGAAIPASKICVTNSAGFVLKWYIDDMVTGEKSAFTGTYPIDQTQCHGIADMLPEVNESEIIETYVKAILGTTNAVSSALIYKADAGTASFTCSGTTLNFHCNLNG